MSFRPVCLLFCLSCERAVPAVVSSTSTPKGSLEHDRVALYWFTGYHGFAGKPAQIASMKATTRECWGPLQ